MRGAEGVVRALLTSRKAGDAAMLAQASHAAAPPGQDLVSIGLMPHVPHQPVVRRVEHVVQRHGQLDRAEVRREVPAGGGDRLDDEVAQFLDQLRQTPAIELAQVGRVADGFQQFVGHQNFRSTM